MTSLARTRYGNFGTSAALSSMDPANQAPTTGSLAGAFPPGGGSSWKTAGQIWGNTAIGSGLKTGTSEAVRSQETSTIPSTHPEAVTGSRSLLASSDADDWDRQPKKPWIETATSGARSSQNSQPGNSPVRRQHTGQITPLQPLSQNVSANSSYYSMSQAMATAQGMKRTPDSFVDSFAGNADPEALYDPFRNDPPSRHNSNEENRPPSISFHVGPVESPRQSHFQQSGQTSISSNRLPSPTSRNGSLPPSRHGLQFGRFDDFQPTNSHGPFDSYPPQGPLHRPNLSANASLFKSNAGTLGSLDGGLAKSTQDLETLGIQFGSMQVDRNDHRSRQASSYQGSHDAALGPGQPLGNSLPSDPWPQNHEAGSLNLGGIVPGSMSMATLQQLQQYRNSPFSGSSASVATNDQRKGQQSPFFTNPDTPPVGQPQLLPSRDGLSNGSTGETALLDRKLRGYQQEQSMYPGPPHVPFRGAYGPPYDYPAPSPLRMNPLAAYYPMPSAPHAINPLRAPRGFPREHDVGSHLRSPLLEEFRCNSKTNKRYELKDIYNHIVEFSGDQHGSRFIQQKLETANSDEKDQVFREIQPNAIQLMTDVFGNYVIQKFFEHGNQSQKKVLANQMKNRILGLSRQMYGCRVVQKALEHILTDQQASLVRELESSVMLCVKDQNGNHVVQKAIERVPAEHIQFIFDAFTGQIQALSVHPYGCRVIQRMLEHCVEPTRSMVLQELHVCAASLIVDQYGNYVTQHIIEHGREADRNKVISLVTAQLVPFSKHKFASNVVEKCVQFSTYEQRQVIVNTLTGTNAKGENTLQHMIQDQYGNYVIQKTLAQLKGDEYTHFVHQIQPHVAILKQLRYSKQITAIEKMISSTAPPPVRIRDAPPVDSFVETSPAPTPPLMPGDGPSPQTASFPSTQTGSVGGPIDSRKSSTSNGVVVLTPTSP